MQRYFFEIAYLGTHYSGWQRQTSAPSIQATIEEHLSLILKSKTRIHGCGRTDAGVHASQYVFHVDLLEYIDPESFIFIANKSLPEDIVVLSILAVDKHANAQRNAISRTYKYYIHFKDNPFLYNLSCCESSEPLDLPAINEALLLIKGSHDFRNFCKSPDKNDNCICNIVNVEMKLNSQSSLLEFTFQGNRFLHHMIRILMGNLLKIGKGKLALHSFNQYLNLETCPKYFDIAYPQGLYLSKIDYDQIEFPERNNPIWSGGDVII